jgi:hypothetical protein
LKRDYGLGTIFAGVSGLILAAALVTAFGYVYTLPRDLRRRVDKSLEIAV